MNISDQIIQLAKENNGVITSAVISEKGILRGNLKNLVDSGRLERTVRGVYILPEIWEDEFVNLQARFKKGIFSNETALFLWDLTDRTPNRYDMTFPGSIKTLSLIQSLYVRLAQKPLDFWAFSHFGAPKERCPATLYS